MQRIPKRLSHGFSDKGVQEIRSADHHVGEPQVICAIPGGIVFSQKMAAQIVERFNAAPMTAPLKQSPDHPADFKLLGNHAWIETETAQVHISMFVGPYGAPMTKVEIWPKGVNVAENEASDAVCQ